MAKVTLKGTPVNTVGTLPTIGSMAPNFVLVKSDLSELTLESLKGKQVVLNIFPSIDTGTCAASVRQFNKEASSTPNTVILCISADLPFAHARFCGAEGISNLVNLSNFRDKGEFGNDYGVTFADGPLRGLTARAVVVVDESGKVKYTELVSEIVDEPNYKAAMAAL